MVNTNHWRRRTKRLHRAMIGASHERRVACNRALKRLLEPAR